MKVGLGNNEEKWKNDLSDLKATKPNNKKKQEHQENNLFRSVGEFNKEKQDDHNLKLFSLENLKEIFLKQKHVDEFQQELKKRYGILKKSRPNGLKSDKNVVVVSKVKELQTAENYEDDKSENDSNKYNIKDFDVLERHMVSSYRSLIISGNKLIEIGKKMLELRALSKISEFKREELVQQVCDTTKEIDLCIEQKHELEYLVKEKTKQVKLLEDQTKMETRKYLKQLNKDIIETLRKLEDEKSQVENEIADIEKDEIYFILFIQELTRKIENFENEIKQLEYIKQEQNMIRNIVSVLHKDFENRLEEYKQAKKKMRQFYEEQAEINRTNQPEQTLDMVLDMISIQPTVNPSNMLLKDVSVVIADQLSSDAKSSIVEEIDTTDEFIL